MPPRIADPGSTQEIIDKALAGERLTRSEAVELERMADNVAGIMSSIARDVGAAILEAQRSLENAKGELAEALAPWVDFGALARERLAELDEVDD